MKYAWAILLSFAIQFGFGQDPPVTTQQQLENTVESLDDETLKDDNFLQTLDYYQKHPINLNAATKEDLQPLRLLTDLQIANMIDYRRLFGNFISIYELQAVPTMDIGTIRKIEPYIYVGPAVPAMDAFLSRFRGGDQYLLGRISRVMERAKGYDKSLRTHYAGDPNHIMMRYRYQFKNLLQYGVVADKDAGEAFFRGAQKQGFDFYSAHFFVRRLGNIKALALGDFLANFGQGLIQWQSLAFGKSIDALSIKRQSPTLMPYRSAGEFYFNRGAGVTTVYRNFEVTSFVSAKKLSGNYTIDSVERFTSFQTSGYYRTPSEISDRYNISNLSFGGSVGYQYKKFRLALNSVRHQFSLPLQKRADAYNYFAAAGKTMWNSSADYHYTFKNLHLFGEMAVDRDWNKALVKGALISIDPKMDISLLYRSVSKKYQAFYANAFTEGTLPNNENGFYAGLVLRPVYGWILSGYADFFQFPFLKYRVSAPSRGSDYAIQLTYIPSRKSEIYARYNRKNKPVNESGTSWTSNFPVDKVRQNLRLHVASQVSPVLNLRSRVEVVWWDKAGNDPQDGFLGYVEVVLKPDSRFSASLRWQYFETGGYDSRIYVYENDVLYSFAIPAFFDKGFRYYINLNYDLNKNFSFWLRWSQTTYLNKTLVGSGLDQISGRTKSEGKFQFVYRF